MGDITQQIMGNTAVQQPNQQHAPFYTDNNRMPITDTNCDRRGHRNQGFAPEFGTGRTHIAQNSHNTRSVINTGGIEKYPGGSAYSSPRSVTGNPGYAPPPYEQPACAPRGTNNYFPPRQGQACQDDNNNAGRHRKAYSVRFTVDENQKGMAKYDPRWEGDSYMESLTYECTLQDNKRSRVYRCTNPKGEKVVVKVYPDRVMNMYHSHPGASAKATHLETELYGLKAMQGFDFVPRIYYELPEAKTFVMEDAGQEMCTNPNGPSTDIPEAKRKEILKWAQDCIRQMQAVKPRPVYHNDVRLQNITYSAQKGKYLLVDWGHYDYKQRHGGGQDSLLRGDPGWGNYEGRLC